jgi:uncharacterized repeat protein (TIGR01451 family)
MLGMEVPQASATPGINELAYSHPRLENGTYPSETSSGGQTSVIPGKVVLYDLATGKRTREIPVSGQFAAGVAFAGDGTLYFGEYFIDADINSTNRVQLMKVAPGTIEATNLPDGEILLAHGSIGLTSSISEQKIHLAVSPVTNELAYTIPGLSSFFGDGEVSVSPGKVVVRNIDTGATREILLSGKDPIGLAYDATGALYFGGIYISHNAYGTSKLFKVELMKVAPGATTATSLGNILDFTSGATGCPCLGQFDSMFFAVNPVTNELAYNLPGEFTVGANGNPTQTTPPKVVLRNLDTGATRTPLVPLPVWEVRGLAFDAAGTLYFGKVTRYHPFVVQLMKVGPGATTATNEGEVLDQPVEDTTLPNFYSYPNGSFFLAYDPGQRIFLDWDTPLDVTMEAKRSIINGIPEFRFPVRNVTTLNPAYSKVQFTDPDSQQKTIIDGLRKILQESGVAIPVLDGKLYSDHVPSDFKAKLLLKDAVRVRFAPIRPSYEDSKPFLNGKAYDRVDQCNRRQRDDRVAVFGDASTAATMDRMYKTTAHEVGHALGVKHINPFIGDPKEVMDYHKTTGVQELFTQQKTEIIEPPKDTTTMGQGIEHNPIYHIRAFSLGESDTFLQSSEATKEHLPVIPGKWDTDCRSTSGASTNFVMTFTDINADVDMEDFIAALNIGPVGIDPDEEEVDDDPAWETVFSVPSVNPSDLSQLSFQWDGDFPLGITASSAGSNDLNLAFGMGDPSNPQLTFDPLLTGTVTGSIFQYTQGSSTPVVVGSFTANIQREPSSSNNADLDLWKYQDNGFGSQSTDPIPVNTPFTYTLRVTNNGPDEATTVVLNDQLPSGVTLGAVTTTQGSCNGQNPVICSIGNLAVNDTVTVSITTRPTISGQISNTASVTGNEIDPNAFNNSSTEVTTVIGGNQMPVANAGPAQTVEVTSPGGAPVTLNGSGSNDPENDLLTFSWDGPFGLVNGPTPTVTLPLGSHLITLTVTDPQGLSDMDSVGVTVQDTTSPGTSITSALDGHGAVVTDGDSTVSPNLTVNFTGTDLVGVTGFECDLDGGGFSSNSCTSPKEYTHQSVGGHTIKVRALDGAANVDDSPATFSWTILTPAQAVQKLRALVESLGLPQGTTNSLVKKLDDAFKLLNTGKTQGGIGKLNEFIDAVLAQKGKHITPPETADALIAEAQHILAIVQS